MKPLYFLLPLALLGHSLMAQTCKRTVLNDDFSSPAGWTSVGTEVNVTNGVCQFSNAYSGSYQKVYKNLGVSLSNTYCKSECVLNITPNSSQNGAGAVVMALTAGNLDFMSYDASQSYQETTQDGIAVVLFSTGGTDNNMNNWQFVVEGKKGNTRTYSSSIPSYANLSAAVTTYYLRLERLSTSQLKLSACTDAAFTMHLSGSPVTFAIDPTITGLNTLQHGVFTSGTPYRLLNGSIDNSVVCDDFTSVGIAENTLVSHTAAYPNPFTSTTTLMLERNYTNVSTQLINASGQIVKHKASASDNAIEIDRSGLENGIYFLQVYSAGQLVNLSKLVIE